MKKILKTAGIILLGAAVVAAAVFVIYRLSKKRQPLKAVDFVASYESVTQEDRLTQEAYATLMDAVFEKMGETQAPNVNTEKPDLSFITHDGNGENIRSYRIFRISARNREYVIYSVDDGIFYKVSPDTTDIFFDMPPIKEACLFSEIPNLVLKTTVSQGPRALGAKADGEWFFADTTGEFSKISAEEKPSDETVELDFGLYDFCFIATNTPSKMTLTVKDEAGEILSEREISVNEKLPTLEKGKDFTLTVKAEWTKTEDCDFYGTVSYVFNIKTTE